jgi:hypothetical protein
MRNLRCETSSGRMSVCIQTRIVLLRGAFAEPVMEHLMTTFLMHLNEFLIHCKTGVTNMHRSASGISIL